MVKVSAEAQGAVRYAYRKRGIQVGPIRKMMFDLLKRTGVWPSAVTHKQ